MLLRSGLIVAGFTLLSRIAGLARDLFIASTFGSSWIADCVNIAFKFPNLFRRLFGDGAMSSVFIPIYSKKLVQSEQEAKKFSSAIFTILLIVLVILSIIIQLLMPYLMVIMAPGFYENEEKNSLAILLCQITTPYLVFVCIVALFGGMLNSLKQFAAFAFVPVIMNISVVIFSFILSSKLENYYSIAWSLIIAGILQVLFMLFCLYRAGLSVNFTLDIKDIDVRIFLKNMWPASLSSGAQQINLFISQSIATFAPGAISILSYADRLYQLPLSLIGISFGTILLPELSKMYKEQDVQGANILLNRAIVIACILSIPATIGLFILAHPIIHFLYERGAFTNIDTENVATALQAFSIGIPAFILSKIYIPIFHANLDVKTPFKIMLYSIISNIILNVILMMPFSYVGIALGSSIAGWINLILLGLNAKKYGSFKVTQYAQKFVMKIVLSSSLMSLFLLSIKYYYGKLFYVDSIFGKALFLFGVITAAIIVFILVCLVQKMHLELKSWRKIMNKTKI